MSVFAGPNVIDSGLILHYDVTNVKDGTNQNTLTNLASNDYNGFRAFTSGTTTVEGITYNRVDLAYKTANGIVFEPKPPLPANRDSPTYYGTGGNWYEVNYDIAWRTNDFTWIVWVYFDSFKAGGLSNEVTEVYVLDWKSQNGRNTSFRSSLAGIPSINYRITTDPFSTFSVSSEKALYFENKWNFMCVRRQSNTVQFFSGLDKSSSLSYTTDMEVADNLGIGWGADIDYNWRTLDGTIGPIQIYNRALTDNEIQQNFNAQRSRFGL
jgi:hypothetical protein